MIDVPKVKQLIADKDSNGLANYIKLHQLKLTNNKITANLDQIKITVEYWDKKQQVKKIGLNSLYGALLNPGCRFHDFRIGQSTTLTGRTIAKHMDSFVNQCITGKYEYDGEAVVYGDTDSICGSSMIRTTQGSMTVEELFTLGNITWGEGGKEYSRNDNIQVCHLNTERNAAEYTNYNYVYRHKVSKKKYRVTDSDGHEVFVTEDHSIMVEQDGKLISKKPSELVVGDVVISI